MARLRFDARIWVGCVVAVGVVLFASGALPAGAADTQLALAQKAIKAGKPDVAIKDINAALTGNGLKGADIARAYYLRGLANSKAGNKAVALADLSHALWLKGLSDSERADAEAARAAVLQQAGLEAPAKDVGEQAAKAIEAAKSIAPAAFATEVEADTKPDSAVATGFGWNAKAKVSKVKSDRARKPAPRPTASDKAAVPDNPGEGEPDSLPWQGSGQDAGLQAAVPARVAAAKLPAAPGPEVQAVPAPENTPDNVFNSLLGGLFGQSPKAQAAVAAEPTPADGPATVASIEPNKGWQSGVKPSKASDKHGAGSRVPQGGLYLQVASLRSAEEAKGLATRLAEEQSQILDGIAAKVQPAVIGNMGTFYTVRLGPVASQSAGESVCAKLRAKGVDCFFATP